MRILVVMPIKKGEFLVRHSCGYYLETYSQGEKVSMGSIDQETAHKLMVGDIPASEDRQGSTASGYIEA